MNNEEGVTGQSLRVFVGIRLDPFFFDGPAVLRSVATRKLAFTPPGVLTVYRQNVLSIVIECEIAAMFAAGDGPLFAVVGETAMAGAPAIRLERFGRPDVKNVVLFPKDTVSPVVLICGVLPLGAAVAMFNLIFALMQISSLQGEALDAASVALSGKLGTMFTTSLAIAETARTIIDGRPGSAS